MDCRDYNCVQRAHCAIVLLMCVLCTAMFVLAMCLFGTGAPRVALDGKNDVYSANPITEAGGAPIGLMSAGGALTLGQIGVAAYGKHISKGKKTNSSWAGILFFTLLMCLGIVGIWYGTYALHILGAGCLVLTFAFACFQYKYFIPKACEAVMEDQDAGSTQVNTTVPSAATVPVASPDGATRVCQSNTHSAGSSTGQDPHDSTLRQREHPASVVDAYGAWSNRESHQRRPTSRRPTALPPANPRSPSSSRTRRRRMMRARKPNRTEIVLGRILDEISQ